MELKPGYKQTEVGVIPEDWESLKVKDLVEREYIDKPLDGNHGNIHPKKSDFVDYGVPFVMANDIKDGKIDFANCSFITIKQANTLQKGFSVTDDVLLTHKGTVGNTAIVQKISTPFIMLTPQVTYYRVISREHLDNRYLRYYFDGYKFQTILKNYSGGGTRAYIGITKQADLPIALPPSKFEQTAIANALSDADALIQSLTRLIAKKRQIKQGAMQTLLNPYENGRLKEGWVVKKLGEIGVFRGGSGFPTRYQGKTEGLYPFYKVSDMNNEGNEKLMVNANNWIDEKVKKEIGSITFPKNTIIFAKIGAAIFLERKKILNQESCIDNNMMGYVFDTNLYNVEYLHYLFQTIPLGKLVSTTALPSLNGKEISVQKYYFPNKLEQTRIATILSDIDAEIAALETKLAKYRYIKQGMMQNLLTGRIRLVKPESKTGAAA